MKKQILIIIISFLSFNSYAQIKFEKGYFITNGGQKKECLIRNTDSYTTPDEFKYKDSNDAEIKTITINDVLEIGFLNGAKYIKETVEIDRSSNTLAELSETKESNFKEESLFLEALIEGEASLYVYVKGNFRRYFYRLNNSGLKQLIFKKYRETGSDIIKTNNGFRQQLWENLKCKTLTLNTIKKVNYERQDLIKYFESFNRCKQSDFTNFINKEKGKSKAKFNLNIRPGILFSSLKIEEQNTSISDFPTIRENDFGSQTDFRIGVELEYVLPFNRNKWALIIEPNYQRNFSDVGALTSVERIARFETTPVFRDVSIEFSSLEIPFGIRHYFFLNDKSKLFLNGGLGFYFPLNSEIAISLLNIEFDRPPFIAELTSEVSVFFGIGYNYQNKYSLEIRFTPSRDIIEESMVTSGFSAFVSSNNSVTIALGYTLF